MFKLDENVSADPRLMAELARNWLQPDEATRRNVEAVMGRGESEEFYRGCLAAFVAMTRLLTDPNYPHAAKPLVAATAAGYIARRLQDGRWPESS